MVARGTHYVLAQSLTIDGVRTSPIQRLVIQH